MQLSVHEIKTYANFDVIANDIIALAKAILPDKFIYINSLADGLQTTLKISEKSTIIPISEGLVIQVEEGLCNRVDFNNNTPLIYEDIPNETGLDTFKDILRSVNINAYLGIPISLDTGERFGTLCVGHHEPMHFDPKSIEMLQKIAKLFSYYLEVEHLAYKDGLTGLFNRHYVNRFFYQVKGSHGTVFSIDLDGFKKVNDSLGHDVGDEVLTEVGKKLFTYCASCTTAYPVRLGGDEFVVILPNQSRSVDIAMHANALLKLLTRWNTKLDGLILSASIGVTTYDEHARLSEVLKEADVALYQAKRKGKNTYHIHTK